MRNITRTLPALGLGLMLQASAFAATTCSISTPKGIWGFTYEGFDLAQNAYCAGIGILTFSTGNLSNNVVKVTLQRESCNGATVGPLGSASGTYSVTSTCTGRSTNLAYTGGDVGRLDFNIVEAGQRLQFLLVINQLTLHGEALKR